MKFEEKLTKIEEISKALQDSNTELEKAVELYEEGMKTANELDAQLSKLERRAEIVTRTAASEDGPIT
ncbi:MAG: exodeoxyribonuclease VII small subunit, partial [Sphaerochaetaceae bacterium]|nr:exodeoxyribonuclease VII small subunit [Sphaerochaetaceae bacterium]